MIKRIPCSPTTRHSNHDHCDPDCGSGEPAKAPTKALTIDELVFEAHTNSVAHGFWDEALPSIGHDVDRTAIPNVSPMTAGAKLAFVHSEISEALECVRDGAIYEYEGEDGKPEGLPTELADACIRIFDLAGAYGIDLEDAITRKMAYNATRPERHGGKTL